MIYITGDIHGTHSVNTRFNRWNFPEQKKLNKQDVVIIAGDFGLIWNGDKEDQYWLKWLDQTKSFTTLFIDGNHENFDLLEQYPIESWQGGLVHRINNSVLHLMRGQVYEIEGLTFFTFGGAASHDQAFRSEGKSWWAREMPSEDEYQLGLANLEKHHWKVDIVITHTCTYQSLEWIKQHYATEVVADPMHDYFQHIQNRLDYQQWYFGHFHQDVQLPDRQRLLYNDLFVISDRKEIIHNE
ncbi:metallophosphoesterase family protein [Paenibacillus nuruki]|uniref:metallophosphoesterase family protein n=1 Tax=Paenibacillus nuruki TaxID=1886670 RepID=UPI002803B61D|nr:metallophosphoesterase [Paenibacillus nuruki]CAJ1315750.1 Metallophosphatase [Paenibacillus nuruki]